MYIIRLWASFVITQTIQFNYQERFVIFTSKFTRNCLAAGLPSDPLGELTAFSKPGFKG